MSSRGFAATLALLLWLPSNAWMIMMGSRQATKWNRKKAWIEQRSTPLSAAADTTSGTSSFTAEIIGNGRIGGFLASAGDCVNLGRDDTIDAEKEGQPILIATRNDALQGIVDACPENRRSDLVFLQNGYLDNFLKDNGLLDNTQVLLYLSVAALGAEPVDGVTSVNPEGLTAATGKHATAFQQRLEAVNMKCNAVDATAYRPAMFEKLIWISTYMLVGAAKECASVGQAGRDHNELVEQVVAELCQAVSNKEGIEFQGGTMERLAAYTDVVTDFPCGVKEFEWRNQYFYDLGDDECPTHNNLLRECQERGFLAFDLPSME